MEPIYITENALDTEHPTLCGENKDCVVRAVFAGVSYSADRAANKKYEVPFLIQVAPKNKSSSRSVISARMRYSFSWRTPR